MGLTQLWSLCTEVAFYLALPVVAALACRGPRDRRWVRRMSAAAAVLVVAGPAWMAVVTVMGQSQARLWLPGFVGWFGLGMLLAAWHAARTTGVLPAGRLDRLAAFPGTLGRRRRPLRARVDARRRAARPERAQRPAGRHQVAAVCRHRCPRRPADGSHGAPAEEPAAVRALAGRVGVGLGLISYGVFAYHVLILELVSRWLGLATFEGGFWQRWLLTATLAVAVSAVSYALVERPVMRRVRTVPSLGRRRPSPSTTHSEAATPSHTPV